MRNWIQETWLVQSLIDHLSMYNPEVEVLRVSAMAQPKNKMLVEPFLPTVGRRSKD